MILTVVMLGIWTIKVAVNNPVQEDNSYMMKYQDVDEKINEILASQKMFDEKYRIDLSGNTLKLGENRIEIRVVDKNGNPVEGAEVIAIVTRPTTSKDDIRLNEFEWTGEKFLSEPFELKRGGRWNIEVKVTIEGTNGFKTYKTFVK
ncbi:FixH family protein [Hydrogenimonas cancrithermarum]|nr:FixH family protein [Hydrogenimonas cancrithermarum]